MSTILYNTGYQETIYMLTMIDLPFPMERWRRWRSLNYDSKINAAGANIGVDGALIFIGVRWSPGVKILGTDSKADRTSLDLGGLLLMSEFFFFRNLNRVDNTKAIW